MLVCKDQRLSVFVRWNFGHFLDLGFAIDWQVEEFADEYQPGEQNLKNTKHGSGGPIQHDGLEGGGEGGMKDLFSG